MLLEHIGEIELAKKLDRALDICMVEERKVVVTGRDTGATAQEFYRLCAGYHAVVIYTRNRRI